MKTGMTASFPIGPDMIFDASLRKTLSGIDPGTGEILFSPLLIKQTDLVLNLDSHKLPLQ
jgi:hypothetical protein